MWNRVCVYTKIVNKVTTQRRSRVKSVLWILWIFQWRFRQSTEPTTERTCNNGGKIFENSQPNSRFPFFVQWETSEGYCFTKERIGLTFTNFLLPPSVSPWNVLLWKGFYSIWTWALQSTFTFPVGSPFIFIVSWTAGGEHHYHRHIALISRLTKSVCVNSHYFPSQLIFSRP